MPAQSPGGAIARVRAETGMLQRRVERELVDLGDMASWLDYRFYLCRMYGFLAPVERALRAMPGLGGAIRDAELRNTKAMLLADDLAALGVGSTLLEQLPQISPPLIDELPEALGWMYVVEASTLEGEQLARQLERRLPSELGGASSFLRCYGDGLHARWGEFSAALDAYVAGAELGTCDRIVLAATDGLIRLHRWLMPTAAACEGRPDRAHAALSRAAR
jgi:heme oxygenase